MKKTQLVELSPSVMRLARQHAEERSLTIEQVIEAALIETLDSPDAPVEAEDLVEDAISGEIEGCLSEMLVSDLGLEPILPDDVEDARVVNVYLRSGSIEWNPHETYAGDTVVGEAAVAADLSLEGTARFDREVRVRFNITLTSGAESVDNVEYIGTEAST